MIVLPTVTDVARYNFFQELDGETFFFEFDWNARANYWVMSISTSQKEPLVMGRPVLLGAVFFAGLLNPKLPIGDLVAIDTQQKNGVQTEAGFSDLGARVKLIYFSPDEVR